MSSCETERPVDQSDVTDLSGVVRVDYKQTCDASRSSAAVTGLPADVSVNVDMDWRGRSLAGALTINSEQFKAASANKTLSTESEGRIVIEYLPDGFNNPDGDFYVKYSGESH